MRRFYGVVSGLLGGVTLALACDRYTELDGFSFFRAKIALGFFAPMALGALLAAAWIRGPVGASLVRRLAFGALVAAWATHVARCLPLPHVNLVPLGGATGPAGEVPGLLLPVLGAALGLSFTGHAAWLAEGCGARAQSSTIRGDGPSHGYPKRIGACALATAIAITLLSATGPDDTHITYWAARALAEHGAIVNHAGARVEQSSSLLLTLVLALLYRLTPLTMPTLGYVVSIAAGWLAILRAGTLAGLDGARPGRVLVFAAMTSPLLAYWALSGMETTLTAWLFVEVAIAQGLALRGRFAAGSARVASVTLAFAMVRPETGLIDVCALAAVVAILVVGAIARRDADRATMARAALLLGVAVACSAALAGFRVVYFGQVFPQPVSVKVGGPFSWDKVLTGLGYVADQMPLGDTALLLLCLPVAMVYELRRRPRDFADALPLMLLVAHFGFVITSGGDWMLGGRFVAHGAPLLAYLLFRAASTLAPHLRAAVSGALALTNLSGLGLIASQASGRPIWNSLAVDTYIADRAAGNDVPWVDRANQTHTRDAIFLVAINRVIDRLLERQPRVKISSGQAGMVMYYVASRYYGRIEFIDRRGLTSRHLIEPALARGVGRINLGLDLGAPRFFQLADEHPDLRPDIVFDIGRDIRDAGLEHDYTCVYEQTGGTRASPPDWFAFRGRVYQFIEVRRELANDVLRGEAPDVFRWTHEP